MKVHGFEVYTVDNWFDIPSLALLVVAQCPDLKPTANRGFFVKPGITKPPGEATAQSKAVLYWWLMGNQPRGLHKNTTEEKRECQMVIVLWWYRLNCVIKIAPNSFLTPIPLLCKIWTMYFIWKGLSATECTLVSSIFILYQNFAPLQKF